MGEVWKNLLEKVQNQQDSIDLLTRQLNEFSCGIETTFKDIRKEFGNGLATLKEAQAQGQKDYQASIEELKEASKQQSAGMRKFLSSTLLEFMATIRHKPPETPEAIDFTPMKDDTTGLPVIQQGMDPRLLTLEASPPDPGDLARCL